MIIDAILDLVFGALTSLVGLLPTTAWTCPGSTTAPAISTGSASSSNMTAVTAAVA